MGSVGSSHRPYFSLFMTKKSNQKSDKPETDPIDAKIESLDISSVMGSTSTATATESYAGRKIALNQKVETFFGVGNKKIWLSPQNYTCVVPQDLTPEETEQLKTAIKQSKVLLDSDKYVAPIERSNDVLSEYFDFIKQYGLDIADKKSKSVAKFRQLVRMKIDRNWSAKEIIRFCIEQEKKYKNRDKIIRLLNNVLFNSDAPEFLLDPTK